MSLRIMAEGNPFSGRLVLTRTTVFLISESGGQAAIHSVRREMLVQEAIWNVALKITAKKTVEHIGALAIHTAIRLLRMSDGISEQDAAFNHGAGGIEGGVVHVFLVMEADVGTPF
jgi:hypothetical protein